MKLKIKQLDVDFIGGQTPLTQAEEKALSLYFNRKKNLIKSNSKAVAPENSGNKKSLVSSH